MDTLKTSWYEKEIELRFCDCDPKKQAKPSTLCKYMADLAGIAFGARGMDHQYLLERGYVFLLSRLSVRIFRMPVADETLVAATWEREVKRAEYLRDFEFRSKDGSLLVEATTSWILVNPLTRQILRPAEFDGELLPMPEKVADVPPCRRLRLRDGMGEPVEARKIRYSDLDGNGHVYNAVYADIALDALPEAFYSRQLVAMQLNFCHEAVLGDSLALERQVSDDLVLVKGCVNGKDSFLCEFQYQP